MKQYLNKPLIVVILLLIVNECFAQDRIILSSGDTIHCTISKVTKNYLYYRQDYNGVTAKGKILKTKIREWNYFFAKNDPETFFNEPEIPVHDSEKEPDFLAQTSPDERFRIALNAGPAYLAGNTEKAIQSLQERGVSAGDSKRYYHNLKMGFQAKGSAYIHLMGSYWLGAMYHGFYSTSEITTPMAIDDDYMYYGKLGERYFVNFAGASFSSSTRYGRSKRIGVNSSFAFGPAFYRDELEMLNDQVLIQGVALGTNLTLGLEYFFRSNISLGLESSLFSSQAKKITVTTAQSTEEIKLEKENYENLSRLDLSLGIIWYW
jgi:hypothetical protein